MDGCSATGQERGRRSKYKERGKIPLDGRNLGPTDTWEQVEGGNGGETGRGKAGMTRLEKSFGRSGGREKRNEKSRKR